MDSFEQQQRALEQECINLGAIRYRKEKPMPWAEHSATSPEETKLPPGKTLLNESVEGVAKAIREFIASAKTGKAGRRHTAVAYLEGVNPEQAAYITSRVLINAAARGYPVTTAAHVIARYIEENTNMRALQKEQPGLFKTATKFAARASNARHKMLPYDRAMKIANMARQKWNATERTSLGVKLLELFQQATGLVEIVKVRKRKNRYTHTVRPTEQCAEWLSKEHARCELLAPVRLPMVSPPRPWTNPWDGGYLSRALRMPMVKTRNKRYLQDLGNVDMPKVYSAINAVQAVPWRINAKVLRVMTQVWREGGNRGGLISTAPPAIPSRPCPKEDTVRFKHEHPEAWKAWRLSATKAHIARLEHSSECITVSQKLWIAERMAEYPAIYFPHQLDSRGRMYPVPPLVNPQADDVGKSLLEFADGLALGEDGGYWLAVHIAGLYGVDKVNFDDRVAWVEANSEALLNSALDPLDGNRFWDKAEKPWCALAACFEWAAFKYHGDSYVSHLPISLDGSCSGLQHYSAALRDPVGGAAVNLVPSEVPADVYAQVAALAQAKVDASADPALAPWRNGKVARKIAKQPTMTFCYSATRYGMQGMILNALVKLDAEASTQGLPRHLGDADNYTAANALSYVLLEAIQETVKAAHEAMLWLRQVARVASKGGLPLRWTSVCGLPVVQTYRRRHKQQALVFFGGQRMVLSLQREGYKLDARRQANAIAPNWVHSLDAAHLMTSVNLAAERGIRYLSVVHDSFGTHAGNTELLGGLLREAFVSQYQDRNALKAFHETLVAQLAPELVGEVPPPPAQGQLDVIAIQNSEYCFA